MEVNRNSEMNSVRTLIEKIAKENDYTIADIDIQAISSGGANYTSELYIATVTAPPKEELKLFIKVACIGEALRISNKSLTNAFVMERIFYSKLATTFEKLYNKYGVEKNDRLYVSKYYGHEVTELKETLVLENLVDKGFDSFDRFKTFDWDYASSAIRELAKFHALGLKCIEAKVEDLHKLEAPDMFADKNMIELFKTQAYKMGTEAVKEEYRIKMLKYFENNDFSKESKLLWARADEGFFIHGDYRPSNLMHRSRNGEVQVVPIDYQTCRIASGVVDLMCLLWTGSDSEFRDQYYQQSIDYYYTELAAALKNLHVDIEQVYTRKAYERELEECKTIGLFLGLAALSILTVEPENAPKMDNFENMLVKPN